MRTDCICFLIHYSYLLLVSELHRTYPVLGHVPVSGLWQPRDQCLPRKDGSTGVVQGWAWAPALFPWASHLIPHLNTREAEKKLGVQWVREVISWGYCQCVENVISHWLHFPCCKHTYLWVHGCAFFPFIDLLSFLWIFLQPSNGSLLGIYILLVLTRPGK